MGSRTSHELGIIFFIVPQIEGTVYIRSDSKKSHTYLIEHKKKEGLAFLFYEINKHRLWAGLPCWIRYTRSI